MQELCFYLIPYLIFSYWLIISVASISILSSCKYPLNYWNVVTPFYHLIIITLVFIKDLCFESRTQASRFQIFYAILLGVMAILDFFLVFIGTFWITEI